jgi:hypothetical protein
LAPVLRMFLVVRRNGNNAKSSFQECVDTVLAR